MGCFLQNHPAQSWLDGLADYEVHAATKQVFQVALQIHVGIEGFLFELNDKIEIAALFLFSTGKRPE
jgi:hypothetical protein